MGNIDGDSNHCNNLVSVEDATIKQESTVGCGYIKSRFKKQAKYFSQTITRLS